MSDFTIKLETTNSKITITKKLEQVLAPGFLPQTTRELIFDDDFNAEIEPGVIPMGTEMVEFGMNFNQKLKPGVFPISVTCIKFGIGFVESLENILPENLKILHIINKSYPHPLNILPSTITDFHFVACQRTKNIPINVTDLYIINNIGYQYLFEIPNSVKKIYLSPKSLEHVDKILQLLKTNDATIILSTEKNVDIPHTIYNTHNIRKMIDSEIIEKQMIKICNSYHELTLYNLVLKDEIDEMNQLKMENDQLRKENREICQLKMENDQLKKENIQLKTSNNNSTIIKKINELNVMVDKLNQI